MFTDNIFIQHAVNTGKKQLGKYFVDEHTEINDVKYVSEYLGCYYHGCPKCFPSQNKCRLTGTTYSYLNKVCADKLLEIELVYGVKLIIMREHTKKILKIAPGGTEISYSIKLLNLCPCKMLCMEGELAPLNYVTPQPLMKLYNTSM